MLFVAIDLTLNFLKPSTFPDLTRHPDFSRKCQVFKRNDLTIFSTSFKEKKKSMTASVHSDRHSGVTATRGHVQIQGFDLLKGLV